MCIKSIAADLIQEPIQRISDISLKLTKELRDKSIFADDDTVIDSEEFLKKILNSNQFSPQIRKGTLTNKEIILIVFYYKIQELNRDISSQVFAILEIELSAPDITSPDVFNKLQRGSNTLN